LDKGPLNGCRCAYCCIIGQINDDDDDDDGGDDDTTMIAMRDGRGCWTAGLCSPEYCLNGGACPVVELDEVVDARYSTFHCDCPDGWYGQQCDASYDVGVEQLNSHTWCPFSRWGDDCKKCIYIIIIIIFDPR